MRLALFDDEPAVDPFHDVSVERVRAWLKDPDSALTAAFVVDAPDGDGLAASVIGAIDERLPSAKNPAGVKGYIYGVCTDERHRRRGYSRLAMKALLDWYDSRGVLFVDLHASEYGDSLYRELGFAEPDDVALTRASERRPR